MYVFTYLYNKIDSVEGITELLYNWNREKKKKKKKRKSVSREWIVATLTEIFVGVVGGWRRRQRGDAYNFSCSVQRSVSQITKTRWPAYAQEKCERNSLRGTARFKVIVGRILNTGRGEGALTIPKKKCCAAFATILVARFRRSGKRKRYKIEISEKKKRKTQLRNRDQWSFTRTSRTSPLWSKLSRKFEMANVQRVNRGDTRDWRLTRESGREHPLLLGPFLLFLKNLHRLDCFLRIFDPKNRLLEVALQSQNYLHRPLNFIQIRDKEASFGDGS